jgi:hypothetical protein
MVLGAPDSVTPATKDAVFSTLHDIGPGTPGLFFYRGHAVHGSDPSFSTLPMTEGVVQAGELVRTFDDGRPFLPMPSRVIISGCSSSGGSLLAGEGLGLAAGIIQSGAEQVISTAIDVMDISFRGIRRSAHQRDARARGGQCRRAARGAAPDPARVEDLLAPGLR